MDTDFVSFRRRFLLLFICIQGLLWRREVREIFLASYCLKKTVVRVHT